MDKISPATKSVSRPGGIKYGEANSTLTTPNPTFGKYSSGYKEGEKAINDAEVFSSKSAH